MKESNNTDNQIVIYQNSQITEYKPFVNKEQVSFAKKLKWHQSPLFLLILSAFLLFINLMVVFFLIQPLALSNINLQYTAISVRQKKEISAKTNNFTEVLNTINTNLETVSWDECNNFDDIYDKNKENIISSSKSLKDRLSYNKPILKSGIFQSTIYQGAFDEYNQQIKQYDEFLIDNSNIIDSSILFLDIKNNYLSICKKIYNLTNQLANSSQNVVSECKNISSLILKLQQNKSQSLIDLNSNIDDIFNSKFSFCLNNTTIDSSDVSLFNTNNSQIRKEFEFAMNYTINTDEIFKEIKSSKEQLDKELAKIDEYLKINYNYRNSFEKKVYFLKINL